MLQPGDLRGNLAEASRRANGYPTSWLFCSRTVCGFRWFEVIGKFGEPNDCHGTGCATFKFMTDNFAEKVGISTALGMHLRLTLLVEAATEARTSMWGLPRVSATPNLLLIRMTAFLGGQCPQRVGKAGMGPLSEPAQLQPQSEVLRSLVLGCLLALRER